VRRLARELGVDLARVRGSGTKGRITHEDVKAWVKQALQGGAAQPPHGAAEGRRSRSTIARLRSDRSAARSVACATDLRRRGCTRSWVDIPHVTQFDEADITDLEALRNSLKERGRGDAASNCTPLAFIIAAVRAARIASSRTSTRRWTSRRRIPILKSYCHLGFAADTPNGLLVPVIRAMPTARTYSRSPRDLGDSRRSKARAWQAARRRDMQGGCFTVSSLGGIGRHGVHAHHQCAGGGHPRRVAGGDEAGVA
jgi:pyruvate dehydrogenase E2 component (dihydrolipoamide acetyltransferase)